MTWGVSVSNQSLITLRVSFLDQAWNIDLMFDILHFHLVAESDMAKSIH